MEFTGYEFEERRWGEIIVVPSEVIESRIREEYGPEDFWSRRQLVSSLWRTCVSWPLRRLVRRVI